MENEVSATSPIIHGNNVKPDIEILKLLYEEKGRRLQFLAERSFNSTLQIITLNVIVLGGLIANKMTLLYEAKMLGSISIAVLNLLVISYVIRKGEGYIKEKEDFKLIEKIFIENSPSITNSLKGVNSGSFWAGTGTFVFAIFISFICTIIAVWIKLALLA